MRARRGSGFVLFSPFVLCSTHESPGGEITEEGGELDPHEEVRLSFAGLGEIKRREEVLDP